jgi:hypothetical protein
VNSEGFYEDSGTWITGKELIERWPRVTPKSLLGRILEEYGFDCPQIRPVIHVIFDEKVGEKVPGPSWNERELRVLRSIGSVEDMKSAIEDHMFFNLLDVKEYEEDHPEVLLMPGQNGQTDNHPDDQIFKLGVAAQRLYDSIKIHLKSQGITLTRSKNTDRRDAAVSIFDSDPASFSPLEKEHIDIPSPYESFDSHHDRKMIGTILLTAIPDVGSDYQLLFKRFKELCAHSKNTNPSK